jgi:hypothetical protein
MSFPLLFERRANYTALSIAHKNHGRNSRSKTKSRGVGMFGQAVRVVAMTKSRKIGFVLVSFHILCRT